MIGEPDSSRILRCRYERPAGPGTLDPIVMFNCLYSPAVQSGRPITVTLQRPPAQCRGRAGRHSRPRTSAARRPGAGHRAASRLSRNPARPSTVPDHHSVREPLGPTTLDRYGPRPPSHLTHLRGQASSTLRLSPARRKAHCESGLAPPVCHTLVSWAANAESAS